MEAENPEVASETAGGRNTAADARTFIVGIGKTIEENIRAALEGRGNVLMVRVNDESLRNIDALVEAGLFKNRSEAAAYLIHEGVSAKAEVFSHINTTVDKIARLREDMKQALGSQPAPKIPASVPEPSGFQAETPGSQVEG